MIELLRYQFIQHAFIAGTMVAVVAGIIGYFVVLRAQAFAAHALAHIGFAGATGAAILGISSFAGTFIITVLAALCMGALGKKLRERHSEIGIVLSFALGLGVLFLKLYTTNANKAVGILFGSILSISSSDLALTIASGALSLLSLAVLFRPLVFSSIDPEVARARGVPVTVLSIAFMVLLAVTVAELTLVVGVLLVFALLVLPAATAQHLVHRPFAAILTSVALALLFTWSGLISALRFQGPVSFFIAGIASVFYLVAVSWVHAASPHAYVARPHGGKEVRA